MNNMFLSIEAQSVAKCWAIALQRVFFEGDLIKSDYDTGDDFPTRDCTSAIHITDPLSEPLEIRGKLLKINNETIYCHPGDVYCIEAIKGGYLSEVMAGDRDSKIWDDSESYPYTYHDRIFNYKSVNVEDQPYVKNIDDAMVKSMADLPGINQVETLIKKLQESPYTRRAQAITWRPLSDLERDDPPCLQRLWFRVFDGKLHMDTHWRSRDLFGAWEANINGMFQIARQVAEGVNAEFTDYVDMCDSLHVYGRRKLVFKEVVPLLERIRNKEGLNKPEYDAMLDSWLEKLEQEVTE